MCKFCDTLKKQILFEYDNTRSMSTCQGQYCGTNVQSDLSIKGNMLLLSGWGHHRSKSDCYYEVEGLDIDNEAASKDRDSILKIEYCPFCGKKLKEGVYEVENATRNIEDLKECINICENVLNGYCNLATAYFDKEMTYEEFEKRENILVKDNSDIEYCLYGEVPKIWSYRDFEEFAYSNDSLISECVKSFKEFSINEPIEFYTNSIWKGTSVYHNTSNLKFNDEDIEKFIEEGRMYIDDYSLKKLSKKKFEEYKKRRTKWENLLKKFEEELKINEETLAKYKEK